MLEEMGEMVVSEYIEAPHHTCMHPIMLGKVLLETALMLCQGSSPESAKCLFLAPRRSESCPKHSKGRLIAQVCSSISEHAIGP